MTGPARRIVVLWSLTLGAALTAGCARSAGVTIDTPPPVVPAPITMPAAVVPTPTTQGILQGIVGRVRDGKKMQHSVG